MHTLRYVRRPHCQQLKPQSHQYRAKLGEFTVRGLARRSPRPSDCPCPGSPPQVRAIVLGLTLLAQHGYAEPHESTSADRSRRHMIRTWLTRLPCAAGRQRHRPSSEHCSSLTKKPKKAHFPHLLIFSMADSRTECHIAALHSRSPGLLPPTCPNKGQDSRSPGEDSRSKALISAALRVRHLARPPRLRARHN